MTITGVFARIFGVLTLTSSLVFGVSRLSHTHATGWDRTPKSAPELDPTAIRGGLIMTVGGLLVLNDRRRKKN